MLDDLQVDYLVYLNQCLLATQLVNVHPIGRLGGADEVAQLFVWLASERASFATGAYYPIDGGYLAQ